MSTQSLATEAAPAPVASEAQGERTQARDVSRLCGRIAARREAAARLVALAEAHEATRQRYLAGARLLAAAGETKHVRTLGRAALAEARQRNECLALATEKVAERIAEVLRRYALVENRYRGLQTQFASDGNARIANALSVLAVRARRKRNHWQNVADAVKSGKIRISELQKLSEDK